jgi:hypothetical protein
VKDLDARLTAALRADAPPARDVMFRVEVLVHLERVRFRRHVMLTVAGAVIAATLTAINARAVEAWIAADVWVAWMIALGAVATLFVLPGVPIASIPGAGLFARTIGRRLYP